MGHALSKLPLAILKFQLVGPIVRIQLRSLWSRPWLGCAPLNWRALGPPHLGLCCRPRLCSRPSLGLPCPRGAPEFAGGRVCYRGRRHPTGQVPLKGSASTVSRLPPGGGHSVSAQCSSESRVGSRALGILRLLLACGGCLRYFWKHLTECNTPTSHRQPRSLQSLDCTFQTFLGIGWGPPRCQSWWCSTQM